MKSKKINWTKYALEFLSIFIAVVSAFALSNWNDNARERRAESKILTEILNGLENDQEDVGLNIMGHREGIKACEFWRKVFRGETVNTDTLQQYYFLLTRDFISIQNTSGYETLKSRGFELITNDTLRAKIISLYEFDYQTLKKLEEEYQEVQFQDSYFKELNQVIAPHFVYNEKGNMVDLELPLQLDSANRKIMLSYIWKIQINRNFVLQSYLEVEDKIKSLMEEIEDEIQK